MDVYMYDRINASHLSRIDNLVMNLKKMDFQKRYFEGTDIRTFKQFTNFSVSEILKPDFRSDSVVTCSSVYDSDSDDTRFIGSVDSYSSDEIHITSKTSTCPRPMNHIHQTAFVSVPFRKNSDVLGRFQDRSFIKDDNFSLRKNVGGSSRFQDRSFVRDDDLSWDSSDNEVALDLRIQRKKTPPKMTGSLPAWVYCTRYSDRPTAGPRTRKSRRKPNISDKRNRTAFNAHQVDRLGVEFELNPYLSETRRLRLATELGLSESSVKVWFQNQRAKTKKDRVPNPLAVRLAEDGLYNHKTVS